MDKKYIMDRLDEIDKELPKHASTIRCALSKIQEFQKTIDSSSIELISLNHERV